MTKETTSFVYVTYIRLDAGKSVRGHHQAGDREALLGPRERLRLAARFDMGACPRQ